jgi:predicted esterase
MKHLLIPFLLSLFFIGISPLEGKCEVKSDDVQTFKNLLKELKDNSTEELFKLHFQSIIDVIDAEGNLTKADSQFITETLPAFTGLTDANCSDVNSYLDRSRYLTISWVSPTDGVVSYFRLRLPRDWDKDQAYPLYVDLHGLSSTANNPLDFLTRFYRAIPDPTIAFEDGYHIAPLARGNLWYQRISETDVWEAIDQAESLFKIDQTRKYLVGHSMGGYGTWSIASKSPGVWAAIGIQAGALWYGGNMLTTEKIQSLSQLPTYFVVGTSDGLYDDNLQAYNLLVQAGNQNTIFVTFNGGHEKLTPNVENMYLWIREFVNDDYSSSAELRLTEKPLVSIFPTTIYNTALLTMNIKQPGKVRMGIFDISGRLVATVINKDIDKGESIIYWERESIPSGVYFYSISAGNEQQHGKIALY